jgi:hypothetical protein
MGMIRRIKTTTFINHCCRRINPMNFCMTGWAMNVGPVFIKRDILFKDLPANTAGKFIYRHFCLRTLDAVTSLMIQGLHQIHANPV